MALNPEIDAAAEETTIGKLWEHPAEKRSCTAMIRKKLCLVFVVLVEELHVPTVFSCFLILLSILQNISLIYDENAKADAVDYLRSDVYSVLANIDLYQAIIPMRNKTMFFVSAYALFFPQLWYLAGLFFTLWYEESGKKHYHLLTQIESILTPILYWVLLTPTSHFFAAIFFCDLNTGKHLSIPDLTCWGAEHIVHITIFVMLFAVLVANLALVCVLGNDCDPYNEHNPFRRFEWDFEIYYAIFRVVFATLNIYASISTLIFDGTIFLGSLLMFLVYSTRILYYDELVRKVFGAGLMLLVWVCFNEIINDFADLWNVQYRGKTVTVLFGGMLMHNLASKIRSRFADSMIREHNLTNVNDEIVIEVCLNCIAGIMLSQDRSILSEEDKLMLLGYLYMHKIECLKPLCPMNSDCGYYIAITKQSSQNGKIFDDQVRLKHMIYRVYMFKTRECAPKNQLTELKGAAGYSTRLLVSCAYYQVYIVGNHYLAGHHLDQAAAVSNSLSLQCTILRAKRLIESLQDLRNRRKFGNGSERAVALDLRRAFEYEAHFKRTKQRLVAVAEAQRKFCSELLLPLPDLNKVRELGLRIVESSEAAARAWERLREVDSGDPKAEIIYSLYLTHIQARHDEGNMHARLARILAEGTLDASSKDMVSNRQYLFVEDTAVIAVGTGPDDMNKIIRASNGIVRIFEYAPTDIVGKDIGVLMPDFLAKEHRLLVENCLQFGQLAIEDKVVDTYGVDKEYYLFKVSISVKQYYDSLLHGTLFLGIVRPSTREESTIVTSPDGRILGISYEVYSMMHELTPVLLREQDIHIFYICPQFYEEFSRRNYAEFEGSVMLSFSVPRNLQSVSLQVSIERALIGKRKGKAAAAAATAIATTQTPSVEELFRRSFVSNLDFSGAEVFKCWCIIANKVAAKGKIRYKVITFGKSVNDAEEEEQTRLASNIDTTIQQERLFLDGLKKNTTDDLLAAAAKQRRPTVRTPEAAALRRNSAMKRTMFHMLASAVPTLMFGAASASAAADKAKDDKVGKKGTEPAVPEPEEKEEQTLEESQTTRKLLLTPVPVQSATPQEETETPLPKQDISVRAALEKEVGHVRNSLFERYMPRTIAYANLGAALFLLVAFAMAVTELFVYRATLTDVRTLRLMTRWARAQYAVEVYATLRALALLQPSAAGDALPLLNLTARNYDYASIADAEGNLNATITSYLDWKLADLGCYTDLLAQDQNQIQIHYIGLTESEKDSILPSSVRWVLVDAVTGKLYARNMTLSSALATLENLALVVRQKLTANRSASVAGEARQVFSNGLFGLFNMTQVIAARSLDVIKDTTDRQTLVGIMMVATMFFFTAVSMIGLIPILYLIKYDTSRMLLMLTQMKVAGLKTQMENVSKFIGLVHYEGAEMAQYGNIGETKEVGSDEETALQQPENDIQSGGEEKSQKKHSKRRRKAYAEYRGNFASRVIEVFVVLILIDAYSLYRFFESNSFFAVIGRHLEETANFQRITTVNSLGYASALELFARNGTSPSTGATYVALISYLRSTFLDFQTRSIQSHRQNRGSFSTQYNSDFDAIVFDSACREEIAAGNMSECETIKDAVLPKGLAFANKIAADALYQVCSDYLVQSPALSTWGYIRAVLNSEPMITAEILNRKFISKGYAYLLNSALGSMDKVLDAEWPVELAAFLCFVFALVVVYLVLWRLYAAVLKRDLFSSKLLFSYLPVDMIADDPNLSACVVECTRSLTAEIRNS